MSEINHNFAPTEVSHSDCRTAGVTIVKASFQNQKPTLTVMKRLATICFALVCSLAAWAQEKSSDYLFSTDGFRLVTVDCPLYYPERGVYSTCTGLYSADGKVLVQATLSNSSYYYVKAGTEVIASRAFQGLDGALVYIPSTVRSIAPDAFTSMTAKSAVVRGFYDQATETATRVNAPEPAEADPSEVARYTLGGMRVDDPQPGVNIVRMSDRTARKVMAK